MSIYRNTIYWLLQRENNLITYYNYTVTNQCYKEDDTKSGNY